MFGFLWLCSRLALALLHLTQFLSLVLADGSLPCLGFFFLGQFNVPVDYHTTVNGFADFDVVFIKVMTSERLYLIVTHAHTTLIGKCFGLVEYERDAIVYVLALFCVGMGKKFVRLGSFIQITFDGLFE